jgi:hypothetical protein
VATLADAIRQGVGIAHQVTNEGRLQEPVTFEPYIGPDDVYGKPAYDDPQTLVALVEQRVRERRTTTGQVVVTRAKITLLELPAPNGAADRIEPIDVRDRFTLADGTTGPIVDIEGLRDRDAGKPFLLEVWLGLGAGGGQA